MNNLVVSEIWGELKRYINTVDRNDAAETLVAVLIDHDFSTDDIKSAFKTDTEVKRAVTSYLGSDNDSIDEEEEEYEEYDDGIEEDDWEN
jgi:hypothetical protein